MRSGILWSTGNGREPSPGWARPSSSPSSASPPVRTQRRSAPGRAESTRTGRARCPAPRNWPCGTGAKHTEACISPARTSAGMDRAGLEPSPCFRFWAPDGARRARTGSIEREARTSPRSCGIGSSGVPRPSLADYVAGTGPRSGAIVAGGCWCWLFSWCCFPSAPPVPEHADTPSGSPIATSDTRCFSQLIRAMG